MKTKRHILYILSAMMLLSAAASARRSNREEGYGSIRTFTKEFTHQYLDGATYRVRFTIDGAVGIQPASQGVGDDYAYLTGYADPNGTITVTMEYIECDGPEADVQWKQLDIWMGNRYYNGDMQRDDDDQQFTRTSKTYDNSLARLTYTYNCSDWQEADPSASSPELLVNASSDLFVGSTMSEVIVNLKLKLDEEAAITTGGDEGEEGEEGTEGVHHREDNKASEKDGPEKYIIPGVIGSVLLGGAGAAANKLRKRRRKNPDGSNNSEEEEEEEEEEDDEPDQLEMELYKDFGDTMIQGADPEYVYACIIRHPKDGPEYVDDDLTSRIQISAGDDYLAVEEHGVVNGWKSAIVQAPENEEPPQEGIVSFRLASAEASYTNNIHFRVVKSGIRFGQDNLTLPARYEKDARLRFVAVGMNDGTADVKITITEEQGGAETKDYSVHTEWNAADHVYEAVIRDLCQNPKDDEGVPGNYISYKISIEATNDKGRKVQGELPLYRYYMGLVLQMKGEVNCFLEEHDPMRHELIQTPVMRDGREYVPAENQCLLKLYDYDEEKHALYIIDPEPVDLRWTLKEIADMGGLRSAYQDIYAKEMTKSGFNMMLPGMINIPGVSEAVITAHEHVINEHEAETEKLLIKQKMIEDLGLQLQARWDSAGEGQLYYILSCRKGYLKAPNRFNAMLEITAMHNGKDYTYKRTVQLLSQPHRAKSGQNGTGGIKRDREIMEELWKIENAITVAGLTRKLAPLVTFIGLQHDYYDSEFGYDEWNYNDICKTYTACMDRESQEAAEAAKEPEGLFNTVMDWVMRLDRDIEGIQGALHKIVLVDELPILGTSLRADIVWRVGLGVGTMGLSEGAFAAIKVPANMQKYVNRGGDSPYGAFFVGAWVVTEAYIYEQMAVGGMMLGKGAIKGMSNAAKGMKQMGKSVTREGMKELVKDSAYVMGKEVVTSLETWGLKQTSWQKGMAEETMRKYAKSAMERLRGNPATRLSQAERIAQQQAMRNIENLQTISEMCRANPTTANLQMKARIVLECQADKNTMMLMKNEKLLAGNPLLKGTNFQATRAQFNHVMRSIYNEVDENMLRGLSEATGVPVNQIKIMRTSSSDATDLLVGRSTTFDRDVTYYFVKDGKIHYFNQELTEQLYGKHFREAILRKTTGSGSAKIDFSTMTAQEKAAWEALDAQRGYDTLKYYDQTPLEDILGHMESYGHDVGRMVNPTLHGEDLVNPHKVAKTVMEKGQSRFNEAKSLWAKADSMPDGLARDKMYCRAIGEMKEGCRQQVKVFDILRHRDRVRNVFTVIPENLEKAVETMRTMSYDPKATLSKVEEGLLELGFTMEGVTKAMYDLVIQIG